MFVVLKQESNELYYTGDDAEGNPQWDVRLHEAKVFSVHLRPGYANNETNGSITFTCNPAIPDGIRHRCEFRAVTLELK